jgi:hypothetical protein
MRAIVHPYAVLICRKLPCRNQISDCAKYSRATKEHSMMDVLMLALAFGFFALAIGYTYACERL